MTRDDIIRMALEVGAEFKGDCIIISPGALWMMMNSAEFDGASAEREACAMEADAVAELREAARYISPELNVKFAAGCAMDSARQIARSIRARGKA